jgi:hypothetical protein
VRDSNGVERLSRGCITNPEQIPLYCSVQLHSSRSGHTKRHAEGQYAITCCTGDFCNNGSFPDLPPIVYKGMFHKIKLLCSVAVVLDCTNSMAIRNKSGDSTYTRALGRNVFLFC